MTIEIVEPSPLRGAIVAMTREAVIGSNGALPWHYRADLQRFKQRTLGSAIIMGRITWESIGKRALPQRRNIVVSRGVVDGVEHYNGVDAAIEACSDEDLWIIGGGQIYRQALDRLNLLDVTVVPDHIDDAGAVTFPEIDTSRWRLASEAPLAADDRLLNRIYLRR